MKATVARMSRQNAAGRDVQIAVDSGHLAGTLQIPEGSSGLVLFAHGSGSSRLSPRNQYVAEVLHIYGCGTFLFDLLTADEEREDEATGDFRFDIPLLAGRLVTATRWLKDQAELGGLKLGYFGSSTGAAAALVAAACLGLQVDAIVSRGGRPDLAGASLPRVKSPTLLVVGEYDTEVLRLNREALARLECEKALKIVPRATHLFEEAGALPQVAEFAGEWFRKYLTSGEAGTGLPGL